MDLNTFVENLHNKLDAHPEKVFIGKSLLMVFLIVSAKTLLTGFFFNYLVSVAFLGYIAYQWIMTNTGILGIIRDNFHLIPAPRTTTKDKLRETPWATWALIIVNVFVFLFLETDESINEFIFDRLVFLPRGDFTVFEGVISLFTSMYLHGNLSHLFGNMCFLWAAGSIVERRIGWRRYLLAYHVTGIAGCLLYFLVHFGIMDEPVRVLGASDAISGIMGIFIVRCYFKKMNLPIPVFGFLPIRVHLQLNAFIVIGMFFAMDVKNGMGQIIGSDSGTAHWSHIGGMLAGMYIAWQLKLQKNAVEERHQEIGSSILDGRNIVSSAFLEVGGINGARKSLNIALEKNPDNLESILAMARIESRTTDGDQGRGNYHRVIAESIIKDPGAALAVFKEFFSRFQEIVEPELQFKIASLLYKENDLDLAARTLELLALDDNASNMTKEKSLYLAGRILDKMGLTEAALGYYALFVEKYPHSTQAQAAHQRILQIQLVPA